MSSNYISEPQPSPKYGTYIDDLLFGVGSFAPAFLLQISSLMQGCITSISYNNKIVVVRSLNRQRFRGVTRDILFLVSLGIREVP